MQTLYHSPTNKGPTACAILAWGNAPGFRSVSAQRAESPLYIEPRSTTLSYEQQTSESITIQTRGVLFDMDGVLLSSIGSVNRCWREWCRLTGVPNWETFEVPHGQRAIDIIRMTRPEMDAQQGLQLIEDLEVADMDDLKVLPGVAALLNALPADRWAVVTSATRRLTVERMRYAGLPVPLNLVCAEDVVNGKPHPEPYRKGAELLGFTPAECIVVEDAPAGMGAGLAAGSRVLAVLGTHTREEMSRATWIVDSLEGVQLSADDDVLQFSF